ncbi:hypothetical protein ZIOFF_027935 [Zingiber officinale]|uniref:Reverse transcriptase Ty1/copia-type domain-containing protein n=1 Tax=Zingiber officinale TaxID=94328 RepID=A0A8J5GKK7_ZINOF|nr:hypothetical protein ZIOFF_027935 [Zingiber officinale]
MTHLEIKEDNGNSVETLKEARQEPCSKKESSMSQKFVSGLVVDEDTDEIGGNSMNRKETGVMLYEEHNNAKAGGVFSQDCNEFRANQLPGEDHKFDEMPQAVHDPCLLEKSMKQTMLQGDKEVSRNEKIERILANPANPDVSASSDILNIDSDARGSLLFKDLDAHSENDDDLELQLAKDAAHIDNVGPSKFTSNFKKTEGSNPSMFGEFKEMMTKEFEITDIGLMPYYLGIEVNQREDGSFISQAGYAREILKKFRMDNSKSINTPVECGVKLSKHDKEEKVDPTFFKSLVGSLRYLTCTRPDILYAVGLVSRYMEDPTTTHLKIAKRILRYIKGMIDFGLLYSTSNHFKLEGYSDSDWGGDIDDRKSTTGFVFFMGDTTFTWM